MKDDSGVLVATGLRIPLELPPNNSLLNITRLRLTGADISIKISYTNKANLLQSFRDSVVQLFDQGYCRMEKDSPRLWVSGTSNSQATR